MPGFFLDKVSVAYPLHAKLKGANPAKVGGRIVTDEKKRQWILALEDITLSINEGDRIGLTGHNGAGKSTFLRLLAGTEVPSQGTFKSEGRISTLLSGGAGMQAYATGYENIRLRGMLQGMSREEIDAAIPEIEEFTELGPYLNVPIAQYSGGMRLRLSFAIATAVQPDILLIDEWMGAGDKHFRKKAGERLEKFMKKASVLVLAAHNPGLLATFCDKIYQLDQGKIQEELDIDTYLDQAAEERRVRRQAKIATDPFAARENALNLEIKEKAKVDRAKRRKEARIARKAHQRD